MNNFDLERKILTDPLASNAFGDVLAADELPDRIKQKPVFYIVNTDISDKTGKRWVVIYIGACVEYFDPLAKSPNAVIEHFLSRISPNGYLRMTSPVQGKQSRNCGQFCLYYCYYRVRNFPMQCIVNSLTLDLAVNDYIVDQFIQTYM